MRLETLEVPPLQPGEALVRVLCCALCGSDIHTVRGRRTTAVPTVLGHEVTGTVEALPPGEPVLVDYFGQPVGEGDRITWSVVVSCGQCALCATGLPQKCKHLFKYGHERLLAGTAPSGGLSQLCVLRPATTVFRVPDNLSDAVVSSANCATATVAAALRACGSLEGASILIQGAGMLGLTAAAMAQTRGAARIFVTDPDPRRRLHAASFGASYVLDSSESSVSLADSIRDWTIGEGVDAAFEFSGNPEAVESGVPLLRTGGTYVLAGAVFPERPVALDVEQVVRGMLHIRGVHNYAPQDLGTALEFLEKSARLFPFESLITRSFPLCESNEAFMFADQEKPVRVAVSPTM